MSAGGCVPENLLRCRRIAAPSSTVVLFFGWQLRAQRLGDYQRRLSVVSHKSASHLSVEIITLGDYQLATRSAEAARSKIHSAATSRLGASKPKERCGRWLPLSATGAAYAATLRL